MQPVTIVLVEDDPGHALLIEKNIRHSLAPSIRAASMCSAGTFLRAADRIKDATPRLTHMATPIRQIVLR